MQPIASVVIVYFRNTDCLNACLESIGEDDRIELIVVNNTHQNRGFGAGCNLGASVARSDVLIFLNPDTQVSGEDILKMAAKLKKETSIGILGPALTGKDGEMVLSVSRQPTKMNFWLVYSFLNRILKKTSWVKSHWYGNSPPAEETDVGIVSGAAMAVRSGEFKRIGGFDENFFLYWEEVDLARRYLKVGLRVVFWPKVTVRHDEGMSTTQHRGTIMTWFRESRYYFMKKNFGKLYAILTEGWLAMSEHWPITIVSAIYGLTANWKGIVLATVVYNEMILRIGKIRAVAVGLFVSILGDFLPDLFVVAMLMGWLSFDLVKPLSRFRRLYLVGALLGSLCLL